VAYRQRLIEFFEQRYAALSERHKAYAKVLQPDDWRLQLVARALYSPWLDLEALKTS